MVLADAKAAVEKTAAVTKEVVDLAVSAQRQVAELFTQRSQASVSELKALAASYRPHEVVTDRMVG